MGNRALVGAGRAGGRLGNVEAEVCLGSKISEVNEACEGCKMPCLGKGWHAGFAPADPLCWDLVLSSLTAEGPWKNHLKSFHHVGEGR